MASGTRPDLDEIYQVTRIIRRPIIESAGEPRLHDHFNHDRRSTGAENQAIHLDHPARRETPGM
jgi:hypothetical protein